MRAFCLVLLAMLLFSIFGCNATPAPPTLTPKQVTFTGFTADGVEFTVEVFATNPNAFPLTVRNVTGSAKLDGKYDLGSVSTIAKLEIPANGTTTISSPLSLKWNDMGALGLLGASNRPIPFQVAGKVSVGSEKLNVDVPYKIDGMITHDQIMQGVARALPGLQGLPRPILPR